MMTETEIRDAITNRLVLRDYDGEVGLPIETDTDGETLAVHLVGENFSRWTDSLDLSIIKSERQFCRKCQQPCVPVVTLTFDGGTRRLHWCAEHRSDADKYR